MQITVHCYSAYIQFQPSNEVEACLRNRTTYTVRLSCRRFLTVDILSARKVGADWAVVTESWLCC